MISKCLEFFFSLNTIVVYIRVNCYSTIKYLIYLLPSILYFMLMFFLPFLSSYKLAVSFIFRFLPFFTFDYRQSRRVVTSPLRSVYFVSKPFTHSPIPSKNFYTSLPQFCSNAFLSIARLSI